MKTLTIFKANLEKNKNKKTVPLNKYGDYIGLTKYFPSFAKEWRNTIYSYNKNLVKNLPITTLNINKVIKGYFNLYFKNYQFIEDEFSIYLRKRRKYLNRIFVSNAEIKHTSNKAIITLYTINREIQVLQRKYKKLRRAITVNLIGRYLFLYHKIIPELHFLMNKKDHFSFSNYLNYKRITNKKSYINYKFEYLNVFLKLKQFYLKKIWTAIILKSTEEYQKKKQYWYDQHNLDQENLDYWRRYNLLHSLNRYKFNKLAFLPLLTSLLTRILGKKIEYNIINIKSMGFNTDIFTHLSALKIKRGAFSQVPYNISPVLNSVSFPALVNVIKEKTRWRTGNGQLDSFFNKYKDMKLVSNLSSEDTLDTLLSSIHSNNEIHNTVYASVGYKHLRGIRVEVKGRLTRRYRADRAQYRWKSKGGFKNLTSSFNGISAVLFRGNAKSNVSYSWSKSKRRIGSFAVKGWIGAK